MHRLAKALLVSTLLLVSRPLFAQQIPLELVSYPDLILYDGKVVSMDDPGFNANVGSVYQAMAVRQDRIQFLGTTEQILGYAGPQTRRIDLKGRTVLPSFIVTHEHPMDWAFQEPRAMTHVFPTDDNDVVIHRWMPNLPPREQLARFDTMMRDALEKAKPGQWVWLSFNFWPDDEHATEMALEFDRSITKEYLDLLAPNTPVKVRNGFITSIVNQKALDVLKDVDGEKTLKMPSEAGCALRESMSAATLHWITLWMPSRKSARKRA